MSSKHSLKSALDFDARRMSNRKRAKVEYLEVDEGGMQGTNEEMVISDDEEDMLDQNEPSESIAKRNMIALNMQNEAEEEEEVDHFIDPIEVLREASKTLEGAAFASRLPAEKMTAQESTYFQDISSGPPGLQKKFLFIRNRLLQLWIESPRQELTLESAIARVESLTSGK